MAQGNSETKVPLEIKVKEIKDKGIPHFQT